MDVWLKNQIKNAIKIIDEVKEGKHSTDWVTYYTGHLQKDILCNFPGRTSKKIFKGYRNHLDNENLVFTQKKFEEHGYEYYVKRGI